MTITSPAAIRLDDSGTAWIEGTTTKVLEVVLAQRATGQTPEELREDLPHLSLPQVQAALAYYDAHRQEIDADIGRRRAWAEEQQRPAPWTRAELQARLAREK